MMRARNTRWPLLHTSLIWVLVSGLLLTDVVQLAFPCQAGLVAACCRHAALAQAASRSLPGQPAPLGAGLEQPAAPAQTVDSFEKLPSCCQRRQQQAALQDVAKTRTTQSGSSSTPVGEQIEAPGCRCHLQTHASTGGALVCCFQLSAHTFVGTSLADLHAGMFWSAWSHTPAMPYRPPGVKLCPLVQRNRAWQGCWLT